MPRFPLFLATLLLLSCGNSAEDGLPPPPFDSSAARIFYPTGLKVLSEQEQLVVASSNFDRAYNSGTLLQLDLSVFDEAARKKDGVLKTLPKDSVVAAARVDSFAGSLVLNDKKDALYLSTRNRDLLLRAPLKDGKIKCREDNCNEGAIELGGQGMDDPYALRLGEAVLPGGEGPEPVIFVNHLAPEGLSDEEQQAFVAVIPEKAFGKSDPFAKGAFKVPLGSYSSNSLAWSKGRGRLFVGGCFLRVPGETVVSCRLDFGKDVADQNILRSLNISAGEAAQVQTTHLGVLDGGRSETLDLAMSSDDRFLYVATKSPSALWVIKPPAPGEEEPALQAVIPLAHSPGRIHVIERPEGDLLAIASYDEDSLLLIDPLDAQVEAQVLPVGNGPWEIDSIATESGHRLFVSLFFDCAVAAVDVPAGRIFDAALVATVGACE